MPRQWMIHHSKANHELITGENNVIDLDKQGVLDIARNLSTDAVETADKFEQEIPGYEYLIERDLRGMLRFHITDKSAK